MLRIGLAGVLFTAGAWGQQYVISTVTGVGLEVPWLSAPAPNAVIGRPNGAAVDNEGRVYFSGYECVFRLDSSGTLTRVAGTGRSGYSGDGGPATTAQLSNPGGVVVDSSGNLYIAANNRIRKVSSDGIITTVAGNGTYGFSGDGGPATSAQLGGAGAVTVDSSGNLYIAEVNRIRKVSAGGIITTVAGGGSALGDGGPATSARLNRLTAVAVDRSGNLYIADFDTNRIRKVSVDGIIITVAGIGTPGYSGDGAPATTAQLFGPTGVAVDGSGNFYIAESGNTIYCWGRIRKASGNGVITTVAGTDACGYSGDGGAPTRAQLNRPAGVAVDSSGNLYIADYNNGRIRRVSAGGIITTVAGGGSGGDGGPATGAQLYGPDDVAVDSSGNLYIADAGNNRVRKVSAGGVITTVAGTGTAGYSGDGGPATGAQLDSPVTVAVDNSGNLYLGETTDRCCIYNRVRKVSAGGIITTVVPPRELANVSGVAVDNSGNLYVADAGDDFDLGGILKVSVGGIITTVAGFRSRGPLGDGGPATSAFLNSPAGVAVDNAGNLYIADDGDNRIRKVSTDGIITTVAGTGTRGYSGDGGPATSAQISNPNGVTVDSSGNVYFSDSGNNRIRKVSSDGIITTVAGTGTRGYSGDGGPATDAQLSFLSGIAVDRNGGKIYVAEPVNNTVRLVEEVRSCKTN